MTLKVDCPQFEGHLSVIEVNTHNAGRGHTHQHNMNQSNGFYLLRLYLYYIFIYSVMIKVSGLVYRYRHNVCSPAISCHILLEFFLIIVFTCIGPTYEAPETTFELSLFFINILGA